MATTIRNLSAGLFAICLAGTAQAAESYHFSCEKRGEVRQIGVHYSSKSKVVPCEVHYIKGGSDQVLWQAQTQQGYCEAKAEEFAELQRQNGWQCRRVVGSPGGSGN